ncbi:MAG: hypothetical protein V4568_03020 [Pseudomonadota bacterium]
MKNSKTFFALLILLAVMFSSKGFAGPITGLYYTSSPSSQVGAGETVLVTPFDGFDVFASLSSSNSAFLSVNDFATNPDFSTTRWWQLDFAAPAGQSLHVGHYANATRYPFQDPASSGLSFVGNNRGDTELTGYFDVLEINFGASGDILSFAANFTQFDENLPERWNRGNIRLNSDVPLLFAVAEPQSLALFAIGLLSLIVIMTRRSNGKLSRIY